MRYLKFKEKDCIIIIEKNFFINEDKYKSIIKELKKINQLDWATLNKIKIYIYVNNNEFKGNTQLYFNSIYSDLRKNKAKIDGIIFSNTNQPDTTDILEFFNNKKLNPQDNEIFFIGDSLIEIQSALNLNGFGILVAKDEWEEQKVLDMNSSNKFICSSIKEALSFIIEIISP